MYISIVDAQWKVSRVQRTYWWVRGARNQLEQTKQGDMWPHTDSGGHVCHIWLLFGRNSTQPVEPHPISLVMAVFELNSTLLSYEGLFVTIFFKVPEADFVIFTGVDMHPPQTPQRFSKPTKRLYKHVLRSVYSIQKS